MAKPPLLCRALAVLLALAASPSGARAQDWKEALLQHSLSKSVSGAPASACDDASAAVEDACKAAHPKCAELRLLFKDAEALEADVASCLAGPAACGAKVYDLFLQRDALYARYHELTPDGGPILLWGLIHGQGERLEKIAPRETVGMATAEVKRLCRTSPPRCPVLTSELSDGLTGLTGRRACGASPCGRAALEAADLAHASFASALWKFGYSDTPWLAALWSEAQKALPQAVTKTFGAEFDALDTTVAGLEATTDELKKRSERKEPSAAAKLEALAASGQAALEEFWAVSLSLDRAGSPLKLYAWPVEKDALVSALTASRKRANALALRLAALRDELIALQHKHGRKASSRVDLSKLLPQDGAPAPSQLTKGMGLKDLKLPSGMFEPKVPIGMESAPSVSAGGSDPSPFPTPGVVLSAPKKTLLDQTQVPKLAPRRKREAPPPILNESPCGFWDFWKCLAGRPSSETRAEKALIEKARSVGFEPAPKPDFPKDIVKVDAMRRLGLTRTVGDPGGVDQLVHLQEGNTTCAVVAQQQILDVFGLGPPGDAVAGEKTLAEEAAAKGFFNGGTPPEYAGDLLQAHGLIVVKHPGASVAELDAALKAGRILLVGVDIGILWGETRYVGGGHAILVTGAETLKVAGKVLGYYVNDSANGKGGWFIPAERFHKAWQAMGSFFAEVR